ncbi:MAG: type I DNA topoisomerase [Rickettsiaceae bacterium]|nr:type I DNA topoisomerase [Rickettsiaceae bacterium]
MKLVIVESPAKAKTINKYLGNDFKVIASFGHIRDLPSKNGSVLPEEDFSMKYEISDKSTKYVNEILKSAKKADEVYLATDPDREGEAISWHVVEVLKNKKIITEDSKFKRIAFNEITKKAVLDAVASPRSLDNNLVNAQQARRALDYLVGFTLSPILWRKLPGCKSAGRVQSVALRLICEREDEIERFKSQEYWDIMLDVLSSKGEPFTAKLSYVDGKKLEKFSIANKSAATTLVDRLKKRQLSIGAITKKQQKRNPAAPFITSSLQQEASRKLGFGAKKTMQIAQKLYEGVDINGETIGLITYMRTDGVTLSGEAISGIRSLIGRLYGNTYLPKSPRAYKSKSKNAQEAHEAIRPTDITLTPEKCAANLDKDQLKLYDLIWKRTMACQMESVVIDMVGADLISDDKAFTARATGSTITFDGFYKIYQEGRDDAEEERNKMLPPLYEGEKIDTKKIKPEQHFTEPPPRFSEASLVKRLEELGIGRPSTYASIISVLQDRNYVKVEKKRFFPNDLGRLVTAFLVGFFERYVEYDFTADLEDELDKVAEGALGWKTLLSKFWTGFNQNVDKVSDQKITDVIDYVEKSLEFHLYGEEGSEEFQKNKKCPSCSDGKLSLKLGKYGAFLACSNYPDCTFKKQVSKNESDTAEISQPFVDNTKQLGQNPEGEEVYLKKGPYGWYVQAGEAKSKKEKPKRSPVPAGINPETLELSVALKLLNLPLTVGKHPETNDEILMGIGRFGPYLKHQNKFTSIPKSIDPFTVQIGQAAEIIAAKKEKVKK